MPILRVMMAQRALTVLLLILVVGAASHAIDVLQADVCVVSADERVEGNLYALCRELNIEGEVTGHVFAAAVNTRITGQVNRSMYLLSGDLLLSGEVGGALHFAGGALDITPQAVLPEADLLSIALSTVLQEGGTLSGEVVVVGYQLILAGDAAGGVDFWGSALTIAGHVGGAVNATVGDAQAVGTATQLENLLLLLPFDADLVDPGIALTQAGRVAGDLTYEGYMRQPLDGQVGGVVTFQERQSQTTLEDLAAEETRFTALQSYIDQVFREMTTLGLLGLSALLLFPRLLTSPRYVLIERPLSSMGVGLLTFMLSFPVFLLLIILTLLLLWLLALLRLDGVLLAGGVLVGMVDVGGISLFYFVAIYLSRLVAVLTLGLWLVARWMPRLSARRQRFAGMLVGVVVVALLSSLPSIGVIFNALALLMGLGAVVLWVQRYMVSSQPSISAAYADAAAPVAVPPPLLSDRAVGYGMDNLPDGFTWWQGDDVP